MYHRYEIDAESIISTPRIVPPTSQNQAAIEADLRDFVQARLALDDAELTASASGRSGTTSPARLVSSISPYKDLYPERTVVPVSAPDVARPGGSPVVVIGIGNEFRRIRGQVHRFMVDRPGAGTGQAASSHGLGLDDAISLAIVLDRMPGRLIVHAIEAADLTQGPGL